MNEPLVRYRLHRDRLFPFVDPSLSFPIEEQLRCEYVDRVDAMYEYFARDPLVPIGCEVDRPLFVGEHRSFQRPSDSYQPLALLSLHAQTGFFGDLP